MNGRLLHATVRDRLRGDRRLHALDNPKRAVTFIQEIRQHSERIADGPSRYVARPDLGETIRICVHGNYLMVFEPYNDGALILRVLHGARYLPGILGSS